MIELRPLNENPVKKRYNNYTLAIVGGVLAGIGITLWFLLSMHLSGGGPLSEWLYQLLCAIFGILMTSQIVSGAGYSFTGFDILFNESTAIQLKDKKTFKRKFFNFVKTRKAEFAGLVIGFLLAVALTVTLVIFKSAAQIATALPVVGQVIYLLSNISMISGLCSRLGRCVDYFRGNRGEQKNIFRGKRVNYVLSVLAGVLIGAVITGLVLGLVGVTSAMTFGGAVPLWVGGVLFVIATTSVFASACGYIGRVADHAIGKKVLGMSCENKKNLTWWEGVKKRTNPETIGTVVGVSAGIALAAVLIGTGLATAPLFGMGLPIAFAGILVMAVCVSGLGGLGNRIGFVISRWRNKKGQTDDGAFVESANAMEPEINPRRDYPEAKPKSRYAKMMEEQETLGGRLRAYKPGIEAAEKKDFDSGRRNTDSGNVKPRVDTGWIPSLRGTKCTFFAKADCSPIPRPDLIRLDVAGNERYRACPAA